VKGGSDGDRRFHVIGGFAEVTPAKLTVLAEEAVPVAEMTAAALDVRIKHAEEDYSLAKGEAERAKALECLEYLKSVRALA
jgi:F-type H+-transporting ATPase subunit epsilon